MCEGYIHQELHTWNDSEMKPATRSQVLKFMISLAYFSPSDPKISTFTPVGESYSVVEVSVRFGPIPNVYSHLCGCLNRRGRRRIGSKLRLPSAISPLRDYCFFSMEFLHKGLSKGEG